MEALFLTFDVETVTMFCVTASDVSKPASASTSCCVMIGVVIIKPNCSLFFYKLLIKVSN